MHRTRIRLRKLAEEELSILNEAIHKEKRRRKQLQGATGESVGSRALNGMEKCAHIGRCGNIFRNSAPRRVHFRV